MSFLKWIEILNWLSKSEISNLEVFCQERFIKSWELLFSEWDEANSMYLLKTGKIEVFVNRYWEELVLWEIKAEDILWEMALFWEKGKRMASARAIEDSVLIVLLDFSIKELTNKNPEILEKIKKVIEQRNEENNEKIV